MMTFDVQTWWTCLGVLAVFNVTIWLLTAKSLYRRRTEMPEDIHSVRRIQLLLSAAYVFGCAYRCVFPVYDVPRLVMYDSWLSSVVIGRSVATVAEVCFMAQLAVMMNEFSRSTGSEIARRISLVVVPLIAVAEIFSWYSVLTTSNIGHVIEESIWGFTAALLIVGIVSMRPQIFGRLRYALDACCVAGAGYVMFMFFVDVPMYWARWVADEATGRTYMALSQGLTDVANRWSVTHRWDDWRNEVAWMSLYFSVAVWLSISLIHAPIHRRQVEARRTRD
jgi:hypothetical protein